MTGRMFTLTMAAGAAAIWGSGCTSVRNPVSYPETRPLGAEYPSAGQVTQEGERSPAAAPAETAGVVTLGAALARALLHNPELQAFSYDVRAAEAGILQASRFPNPELELEVAEYNRDGAGFDSAESVVALGQRFELGGKRRWRTRMAEVEGELAGWDYESKRLDVFTQTAQCFMAVLAAQRRFELAQRAVALAEQTSRAANARVNAGKKPPLQTAKSAAEEEMTRIQAQEAEGAVEVARRRLAALWGEERTTFGTLEGDLDPVPPGIPPLNSLRRHLATNPDLARWDAALRLQQATLSAERAARIPDLEARIGFQRYQEDGTDALAFGVGLPLPLFDRNQGNIAAARLRLAKVTDTRRATELKLAAELAATHAGLTAAHGRVTALRSKVVPAMRQAYEAAHEGYTRGKFSFLDMLDAQRGLFQAEGALTDALEAYHRAAAELQRLTATPLESLLNLNEEK